MEAPGKIAIVILNWNGEKLFPRFLPSVMEHSSGKNTEIIVADNGSEDNSIQLLKTDFPLVKIIDLDRNLGFAGGYNEALKQVDAEYFVIINSDVKVTKDWLRYPIEAFHKNAKLAVIQPKILSYNLPDTFEYAGAAGGYIDLFGYPFCKGRLLNSIETDKGQYDTPASLFWASGACMFVKADLFRLAGGFDADFWAHMEEIDLCWRLKNMGYEIGYEPRSVVYHLGGGTLSYQSHLKIYLNFRNNLWMLFKNLPPRQFKRIFFIRMVLDGVAAVKFLAGFYFSGFWAVLKAHSAFYGNLLTLIKKRRLIQKSVIKKEHPEIYRKSLMWNFFIRGRKKFSDLNFIPLHNE